MSYQKQNYKSYHGNTTTSPNSDSQIPLTQPSPFDIKPKKQVSLMTYITFIIFYSLIIWTSTDTPIILSSATLVMKTIEIDYASFGWLGAIPFLGKAIASIIYIPIYKYLSPKRFLSVTVLLRSASLISYYYIHDYNYFLFTRFLFGFFQFFESFYFPGWCQEHIPDSNIVHLFLQASKPWGLLLGMYLNVKFNLVNWVIILKYIGFIMFVFGWMMTMLPRKHYILTRCIYAKQTKSIAINYALNSTFSRNAKDYDLASNAMNTLDGQEDYDSDDMYNEENVVNLNDLNCNSMLDNSHTSTDQDFLQDRDAINNSVSSYWSRGKDKITWNMKIRHFAYMLKEPQFILSLFTRALFAFVYTFLQFWWYNYMTIVMEVYDNYQLLFTFNIICLLSPFTGIILNIFVNCVVLRSKKKFKIITLVSAAFTASILGSIIPLISDYAVFTVMIWIFIILSTFYIPSIIGICIGSTYRWFKLETFVFTSAFVNIFGSFASIYFYGWLNYWYTKESNRVPMYICMNFSWFVLLGLSGTLYFNWITPEKKKNKKKEFDYSEGTNYWRLTKTSEVNNDVAKVQGGIVPSMRITITDDEDSVNEDNEKRNNTFSVNDLFQANQNQKII